MKYKSLLEEKRPAHYESKGKGVADAAQQGCLQVLKARQHCSPHEISMESYHGV
jgi:hypothetical protein